MKKKLIRLASLWLAVLMLSGIAFAADITVDIYTGNSDLDSYNCPDASELAGVTLSSETDEFSLEADAVLDALSEKTRGRDITGWNVWDKVYSGDVFVGIGSEPTVYGDDAVFTAEQLSDKIIDPIYAEEDIRNFVVLDQIGAIDILSENLFYWVNFADEYARRIKHNFTGNGAFDLEEMVLSGVKTEEGYVVEGWRIWASDEDKKNWVELSPLSLDAKIEPDSDILSGYGENFIIAPVVSKLAEITVQPMAQQPTVKTDADGKAELIKEYSWYSVNEETEAVTEASGEDRVIRRSSNVSFSDDGKKWYIANRDAFADVVLSEGEKITLALGSDDEEATPALMLGIETYPVDPETGELDAENRKAKFFSNQDGVFEYTADKACVVRPQVWYGTALTDLEETDGNDYVTMDILKRSDIAKVEGEETATLEGGNIGERYFGEVTVTDEEDRSVLLTSDSFILDYRITHQPTGDEPYIETNKDEDIAAYAWYQVGEEDILLEGETEATLSELEDGAEYYAVVTMTDESVLTSDTFLYEKPRKPQGGGLQAGGDMSTSGSDQSKDEKPSATVPDSGNDNADDNSGDGLASGAVFTDIPADAWYKEAAEWMGANGYMGGTSDGVFSADMSTTRAMVVTILWRMYGSVEVEGVCPFEDVVPGSYYEKAVAWAQKYGVINGTSETTFTPDALITREQLATIIFRNEVRKGMDAVTLEENLAGFEDADKVSEYAVTAMNWAIGQGIINGVTEDTLAPQKTATRAECATMLYRMENK